MKKIGLIGGMSWESTQSYYRIINEEVKNRLGGLHSAKIILYSVDFDEIEKCQSNGEWERCGEILGDAAQALERAGADVILICTNTMHKVAPQIASKIHLPILHIAKETANELHKHKIKKVGLLGTKYTMMQEFYKQKLMDNNIEVIVPEKEDIEIINDIIFQELCVGNIKDSSCKKYKDIIAKLETMGAKGIVLGCTEIGLLIHQGDVRLPMFDTTYIHALSAVDFALMDD